MLNIDIDIILTRIIRSSASMMLLNLLMFIKNLLLKPKSIIIFSDKNMHGI